MKHIAAWGCALLLCAWAQVAGAADPFTKPLGAETLRAMLAQPAAQLAQAQVLRGRFTHTRYLSEIPKPLVASGEFIVVKDLGVYWHTLQPFDSAVVLSHEGILQKDEGRQSMRLSASEQPALRVITDIFLALFTLDVGRLDSSFRLYGVSQGARWDLGLEPKANAIATVFQRATVSGSRDVEQVVLTDPHGDRTVIELTGIQYSGTAPAADVRALFTDKP